MFVAIENDYKNETERHLNIPKTGQIPQPFESNMINEGSTRILNKYFL